MENLAANRITKTNAKFQIKIDDFTDFCRTIFSEFPLIVDCYLYPWIIVSLDRLLSINCYNISNAESREHLVKLLVECQQNCWWNSGKYSCLLNPSVINPPRPPGLRACRLFVSVLPTLRLYCFFLVFCTPSKELPDLPLSLSSIIINHRSLIINHQSSTISHHSSVIHH